LKNVTSLPVTVFLSQKARRSIRGVSPFYLVKESSNAVRKKQESNGGFRRRLAAFPHPQVNPIDSDEVIWLQHDGAETEELQASTT
jgi:hypothetical protein